MPIRLMQTHTTCRIASATHFGVAEAILPLVGVCIKRIGTVSSSSALPDSMFLARRNQLSKSKWQNQAGHTKILLRAFTARS